MGVRPLTAARRRAVFLDRDGVLNRTFVRDGRPYPPAGLEELEIVPEAPACLEELKRLGLLLLVVSNQPDVARGVQSAAVVEQMHAVLRASLPIDDFLVCFHDDSDGCACRKPRPGLLMQAAKKYGLELTKCYMIGDRWRDIDAGRAARCKTIWIDHGYRERGPLVEPDARVSGLQGAVEWIRFAEGNAIEANR